MQLTLYFLRHELRVQGRSWRFRCAATLYLAVCAAPPVAVFLYQRQTPVQLGAATYAADVLTLLPVATAALAVALATEAILRERESGMWVALTMMPMSSAAYLLRRFLAVTVLVLALSVVPLALALTLAAAAGAPAPAWSNVAFPWLLQVLPAAFAGAALALGMCTIANGVVAGLVQGALLLLLGAAAGNWLLAPAARHLGPLGPWLGVEQLTERVSLYRETLRDGMVPPTVPASEGGFDAVAALGQWATSGSLLLGAGCAALGAGALFLRRSRRDVQPWRVAPTHPLRDLIDLANRVRQRYVPDARPASADRLALCAGLAALAAALALYALRDGALRREAARRYAVEASAWPAATSPDLVPTRWALAGRLAADAEVRSRVAAAFRNAGPVAHDRLAFSLNPGLQVISLGASRGGVRSAMRWDRLEVRLTPPLAPGEERTLTFVLAGIPAEVRFALPAPQLAFFARWQHMQTHRVSHELSDLTASYQARAVSPRHAALSATDLLPVPRFTSWTLEPRGSAAAQVPAEELLREVDLTVDLAAPSGLFLADSCGDATGEGAVLHGGCRTVLDDFVVRGGRLLPAGAEGVVFALLPQHRALGGAYAASLAALAEALPRSWPSLGRLARPVVLEWSPDFDLDPRHGMGTFWGADGPELAPEPEAHGALLLVPESTIVRSAPLTPNRMLAELVSGALLRRRTLAEEQRFAVAGLVRALVARRLGAGPANGAVLTLPGWKVPSLELPLLDRQSWIYWTWTERLDALAAYLAARVGDGGVVAGLDRFVSRPRGGGTMEELLGDLAAAGGTSLAAFYRDYCRAGDLPELTLRAVHARRRGAGWEVGGMVENRGSGEVVCPVVVETDLDRAVAVVRVAGTGSTSFTLDTPREPQAVELDPEQTCHRYRPLVPGAVVEYVGLGGHA